MKKALQVATFSLFTVIGFNARTNEHHHETVSEVQSQVISAVGVVKDIDLESKRITVHHDPIAAVNWLEMTMCFTIAPQTKMNETKIGDKVAFNPVQWDNLSLLQDIRVSQQPRFNEMKKTTLTIGSVVAGNITSTAGLTWFAEAEPSAGKTPIAECKILSWYDPMYFNMRFDKLGGSPFMDMDLVLRYADEESSVSGVRTDPTQTQNLGVRTVTVIRGPLTFAQSFLANVSYNEYQYATVQARAAGFADKVCPFAVGDKVQKGTPFLDLVIPDWVEVQSGYLLPREVGGTVTQTEGIPEQLRLTGMPEVDIRRLIATQKIQTRFTLKASIDGVITVSSLRAGMNVAKDNIVAEIQGMNPVWVTAAIPGFIVWLVRDASQFTLTVSTRPDKTLITRKWTLLPGVDAATRTLQLRLEADSADEALKPGMNA